MNESLIQKQVCTLEQAEKLKELGFSQKSIFYHFIDGFGGNYIVKQKKYFSKIEKYYLFSAYTETELKAFYPYGVTHEYFDLFTLADDLIKLVEENEIPVEDLNDGYLEYFNIEL